MRTVVVSTVGADHQQHSFTTEASSLFDARRKTIRIWAVYWWFDPKALLIVSAGEELGIRRETFKLSKAYIHSERQDVIKRTASRVNVFPSDGPAARPRKLTQLARLHGNVLAVI